MSRLRVYPEGAPDRFEEHRDAEAIARALEPAGVAFERWTADRTIEPSATQEDVLAAYARELDRLREGGRFPGADVVSMNPSSPNLEAARTKFLSEHVHSEDEIRFFVEGSGLFYIHHGGRVYGIECHQGDLIRVPAGTPHWFDMGPAPHFRAIRLFTNPAGWVANYTGSTIADSFPRMDAL